MVLALCVASPAQAGITHPDTGTSFGPGGVGSGTFGQAVGVTVAQPSGDVFVLDASEGGRVYKFDAAGEPVDFSSSGTNVIAGVGSAASAEGELAVDDSSGPGAGDIYVANSGGVRIYAASGAFLGELSGGEMCGVAVDPTGNVYVGVYPETVRRYAPASNPVTNADETGSMGGLSSVCNVAVDAGGDVYAATYFGGVHKYDALQFGSLSASGEEVDSRGRTLAVDPVSGEALIDEETQVAQYEGSAEPPKRVGVSGASGAGALANSLGVDVDHASGELYVAAGESSVEIFGPGVLVASASAEAATGLTSSEATLNGTVAPEGVEVTSCVFEYGTEAGALSESAPCAPATPYSGAPVAVSAQLTGLGAGTTYRYRIVASSANGSVESTEEEFTTLGPKVSSERVEASELGSNTAVARAEIDPSGEATTYHVQYGTTTAYGSTTPPVEIEAGEPVSAAVHIAGLQQNATYHFRFVAVNAGATANGPDATFTTHSIVEHESFSEVGSYNAALSAEIDPGGEATTYHVEYGATTAYGSSTQPVNAGSGEAAVPVVVRLNGLQPGLSYHFRFVAAKGGETGVGADVAFTTHPLLAPGLPDGRGYEKVSPNENAGSNVYQDIPSNLSFEGQSTERPFIVASDGDTITYVGGPSEHGGIGVEGTDAGNQYLARHNAGGGWSSANVVPPAATLRDIARFVGFTDDLSVGFVNYPGAPLAAGAPGEGFETLYSKTFSTGAYEALVRTGPPNRSPREFGAPGMELGDSGAGYAGSSTGPEHSLFAANDALTPNAHDGGALENNLYDSSGGTTTLVNILPDGHTDPNATFGGPGSTSSNPPILSHDISSDASRIFWTDQNSGNLYVRENDTAPQSPLAGETCTVPADACTVLIAESARFWNATPDGSKVLYTQGGDLYEKDLDTGQAIDLAPHGEVKGVAGSSEDLSYVYFVADAALAPGAQEQACDEEENKLASATRCNLYAAHLGEPTRFIGALSPSDNRTLSQSFYAHYGVWQGGLADTEAEVTPDGAHLLFVSTEPLTGYESRERGEVFLYDFGSSQLSCVSCSQTGEAPPRVNGENRPLAAYLPSSHLATKAPQWISDDADRVFFDSNQALVSQDTNNRIDAYEWEADGSGSCTLDPGCIFLLSDGTSPEGSWLIGSSASGDDVFFTTRGKLVPADENENIDVYDARVGVTAPPASPQCTGSGCQGVPSAPPIFATPPSATFNGVGNFAPPSSTPVKAKAKPLTRAQKLAKALKACKKKAKRKRAACERQARAKYGAKAKTKKKPSSKQRGNVKQSSRRGK